MIDFRRRMAARPPPPRIGGPGTGENPHASAFDQACWSLSTASSSATIGLGVLPAGFDGIGWPGVDSCRAALRALADVDVDGSAPVVVIDLETSGLGARCVPFIVGVAWHDGPASIGISQWTLRRGASEAKLLDDVAAFVGTVAPSAALVSFNGASFDIPVLRRRMTRHGVDLAGLASRPHLDVLGAARSVWKGVTSDCRLATLEREILGIRRRGDVEGWEIAELFGRLEAYPEAFVEDPWCREQLERAQRHNRGDLVGLLAVLGAVADVVRSPSSGPAALRVAQYLVKRGHRERALRCLVPWLPGDGDPDEPVDDRSEATREALLLAARLERRQGQTARAERRWRQICAWFSGDPEAHEALAKVLEHERYRYREALEVARGSASPCPRRIARLERKLGGLCPGRDALRAPNRNESVGERSPGAG